MSRSPSATRGRRQSKRKKKIQIGRVTGALQLTIPKARIMQREEEGAGTPNTSLSAEEGEGAGLVYISNANGGIREGIGTKKKVQYVPTTKNQLSPNGRNATSDNHDDNGEATDTVYHRYDLNLSGVGNFRSTSTFCEADMSLINFERHAQYASGG